jgi:very-short-patch-repair endonuclease
LAFGCTPEASRRVLWRVTGGYLRYQRRLKPNARALRRDPTPAERKLWFDFLRDLPEKFTRQKPLGAYIADFYCARHRLVIEIDGDSHYTDAGKRYDDRRSTALAGSGVRVLRFTNTDVIQNFEGVCLQVLAALPQD